MNKLDPTIKLVNGNSVKRDSKGLKKSKNNSNPLEINLDRITLSETSKNQETSTNSKKITGEVRHDLVNKFRNVLRDGTYSIKADEIADKIVQKIRDNKNHLAL
tara:strand:- start:2158 stop:2469 length:312 start_codon:yes stop_codon:yes gene_type:complete